MKFVFITLSLLYSSMLFGHPVDSVRSERRSDGVYVIHKVEDQETIYSIAKRYGGSVAGIIRVNGIVDSRIEIGEEIAVKVEEKKPVKANVLSTGVPSSNGRHFVEPGETLYGISKMYDVKIKQLRKWNDLEGNDISPGMLLRIKEATDEPEAVPTLQDSSSASSVVPDTTNTELPIEEDKNPYANFEKYLVQTGETLHTIATKIGVKLDSLKTWNELNGDYLQIGQELFFRKEEGKATPSRVNEPKKKLRTQIDDKGFEKIFEEGIVAAIESMNTSRFLALHRHLPIGTDLEVRNLMNNQVVHVKVVGKLPDTGTNRNVLLRISKPAYKQLGILDSKSRAEVSYTKN